MNSTSLAVIAIALTLLALLLLVVNIYNRLTVLFNRYRNAYAQIDVQLKRRHDLVPNLVESVKGYMAHERQTLEAVTAARNAAAQANAAAAANPANASLLRGVAGAESALQGALAGLLVRVEAYPQLRASQNVTMLMEELSSTENRIAFARQAYNDAVMAYNTARQVFPSSLLAGPFGFSEAQLFELQDVTQRSAVRVSLAADDESNGTEHS